MISLDVRLYDAVLFDLDGVLTPTADVHADAWKCLFDGFLAQQAGPGAPYVPFDKHDDYRRHVDGKPRDAIKSISARSGRSRV